MKLLKKSSSQINLIALFISLAIVLVGMGFNAPTLVNNVTGYKSNNRIGVSVETTKKVNVVKIKNNQYKSRKQYQTNRTTLISKNDINHQKITFNDYYLEQLEASGFKNSKIKKVKKNNLQISQKNKTSLNNKTVQHKKKVISKKSLQKKSKHRHLTTSAKTKKVSKRKTIDITDQLLELQIMVNNIDDQAKISKQAKAKALDTVIRNSGKNISSVSNDADYWQTVYSIESKQGKLLYRPRNKARNCNQTLGPCGHHQLTVQALRDIGCKSMQCRKDRLDFNKSLKLSKKLLALNERRLRKDGIKNLKGYEKYLIHQQGANGIKNIIAATKGKKVLSKTIKKNMANNSPYSYKQYKRMGSKIAAKKFLKHWEKKWMSEKRMILASNTKSTKRQRNNRSVPSFNDNDLNFALNMLF